MKAALQLYSIRDYTEKDFKGTLRKVAEMGYTGVEFAGYGGLEANELRALLDELKLEAVSSHVSLDAMRDNLDAEIDYLVTLGAKNITCPWGDVSSRENALKLAAELNEYALRCKEKGLTFSYHNHAHEFTADNGELPIDIMLDNAPDVMLEPDLYWVAHAGVDPLEYLKKRIDRCALMHFKQMKDFESKENTTADNGVIDFKAADELNPEIPKIYEQETCAGMTSMQAAELSVKYLLGL